MLKQPRPGAIRGVQVLEVIMSECQMCGKPFAPKFSYSHPKYQKLVTPQQVGSILPKLENKK
jgi:hypothetical protein